MKELKLTLLVEHDMSLADLANLFGKFETYVLPTRRYVQFTFPSVKFMTAMHLRPLHDLVKRYEQSLGRALSLKWFMLQDADWYSPVSIACMRDRWFTCHTNSWEEIQSSPSLFGLF